MSSIAAAPLCPFCGAGQTMERDEKTTYLCSTQYQGKGIYRRSAECEWADDHRTTPWREAEIIRASREKEQQRTQEQREIDEARTTCIDALPKLWWGLFRSCMEEGFTSEQALALVQTFIAKPLG